MSRYKTIEKDGVFYQAEFIPPANKPGLVENENKWRLVRFSFQENTGHPREKQIPREKTIDHFDSIKEAFRAVGIDL